LTRAN